MTPVVRDWLKLQLRQLKGRWLVLLHDAAMIPLAWILAYWFRYNFGTIPEPFLRGMITLIPLLVVTHSATLVFFGVHRGVWRFISMPDLVSLVKAVAVGTLLVAIAIFFLTRLQYVPRSVLVLHGILLVVLLGGPRLLYRLLKDHHISTEAESKVLVVGAGAAGENLVRDLHRARPRVYEPIAFVDDDEAKRGKQIHGVRVMGNSATIPMLVDKLGINLIVIAVPTATASQMQRIVEWCERSKAPFRTLPKLHDLLGGTASASDLRKVQIDDLLGRKPVSLDWESIRAGLHGRRIMITGGGGSIGSELCRQLARIGPESLILFEQSEFNLYSICHELQRSHPGLPLVPLLGDICDANAVDHAFSTHRPQVVFHAAAYKHVPLLQEQIRETIRNNVVGTRNVASAAYGHECEAFVLISTDKAVNPISMMGASKRIAEIYCQSVRDHSGTRFMTVRFGNVLGSAGSVVPLFRKQIEEGGPVTVTHPEMVRYFMTMSEACQLILQASVIGEGSEIFVLEMGEPVNIAYLARQMIRLSGKVPGTDIEIVYSGLRPGEKLSEELFHPEEQLSETGYDKIRLAASRRVDFGLVEQVCAALEQACRRFDITQIERAVQVLVPEYCNGVAAGVADGDAPALEAAAGADGQRQHAAG